MWYRHKKEDVPEGHAYSRNISFRFYVDHECKPTQLYTLITKHLPKGIDEGFPELSYEYKPIRFKPKIQEASLVDSIYPDIPGVGRGEAEIALEVTDDKECGIGLEDVEVTLTNKFVSGSGSHSHFTSATTPGVGEYVALNEDDVLGQEELHVVSGWKDTYFDVFTAITEIEGKTDDKGIYKTRYKAGRLGGTELIDIEVKRPKLPYAVYPAALATKDKESEDASFELLDIKVPGLVQLPVAGSPEGYAFIYGGTCAHEPKATYVTPSMKSKIDTMNFVYDAFFNANLSLNDASLAYGGLFDNQSGGGLSTRCHSTHRIGTDVDVNSIDLSGQSLFGYYEKDGLREKRVDKLEKFVRRFGLTREREEPIHFRGL